MVKDKYSVIGLMSGTSLDGLDIAHVLFTKNGESWDYELYRSASIDYSRERKHQLATLVDASGEELIASHNEFGRWLGLEVRNFLEAEDVEVDFIASHGHTIFHQIDKKFTFQIGAGQEIANESGLVTISDFRSKDVSLGGQGAPLVPIGDQYLYDEYDFCLNLGGISNVSFRKDGERVAFDIGLANMLLNYLTNQIGLEYDNGGILASSGQLNTELFEALNRLKYFDLPFPKSLGYEWFEKEVIPIMEQFAPLSIEDRLNTCIQHEAYQIAQAITPFIEKDGKVLVTGGGAKNDFFVEKIQFYTKNELKIVVPSREIVDFKESIVFAFMGVLRWRNEINCLSSVTGAKNDSSGGVVHFPG